MDGLISYIDTYFSAHEISGVDIAVGVSGGADSMALCFALSEYFARNSDVVIHAITVDHGLRAASVDEALHVAGQLNNLNNVKHHILKWEHSQKPTARIQEQARFARYDLMQEYMGNYGIKYLFLGHHMDDQAETFLFRLAKGSGVDGLACMADMQVMGNDFTLCRPMLGVSKVELIEICENNKIDFINDPSNDSDNYARVRIRKSMEVLAAEGLTSKRLSVCANRHARARCALEEISIKAFENSILEKNKKRIVFNLNRVVSNPDEIILRIVLLAMNNFCKEGGYGARMGRVESLCSNLNSCKPFTKRTLGGIIFECDYNNNQFILYRE